MNHYELLGVSKTATLEEIHKAFRQKAKNQHPDVNQEPSAEESFKKLTTAYDTLRDPAKRQAYDATLSAKAYGYGPIPMGIPGIEFFDDIMNAVAEPINVLVPLRDAHKGCVIRVSVKGVALSVKLPAEVQNGAKIRVMSPTGPILFCIRLKEDKTFTFENGDLYSTVEVTPWEAALGSKIRVETLLGTVEMAAKSGVVQLKGKGYTKTKPLFVRMKLVLPPALTETERQLFEQLAAVSTFKPRE